MKFQRSRQRRQPHRQLQRLPFTRNMCAAWKAQPDKQRKCSLKASHHCIKNQQRRLWNGKFRNQTSDWFWAVNWFRFKYIMINWVNLRSAMTMPLIIWPNRRPWLMMLSLNWSTIKITRHTIGRLVLLAVKMVKMANGAGKLLSLTHSINTCAVLRWSAHSGFLLPHIALQSKATFKSVMKPLDLTNYELFLALSDPETQFMFVSVTMI